MKVFVYEIWRECRERKRYFLCGEQRKRVACLLWNSSKVVTCTSPPLSLPLTHIHNPIFFLSFSIQQTKSNSFSPHTHTHTEKTRNRCSIDILTADFPIVTPTFISLPRQFSYFLSIVCFKIQLYLFLFGIYRIWIPFQELSSYTKFVEIDQKKIGGIERSNVLHFFRGGVAFAGAFSCGFCIHSHICTPLRADYIPSILSPFRVCLLEENLLFWETPTVRAREQESIHQNSVRISPFWHFA